MTDVKKLLGEARRPEAIEMVCTRGDLAAVFADLEAKLTEVDNRADAADTRLGGRGRDPEAVKLSQEMEEIREQMRASSIPFTVRALSRRRWQALVDEHPPRRTDTGEVDARDKLGVNSGTFFTALLRECTVSPALDDDDWRNLIGDDDTDGALTDRQFDQLAGAAWAINRTDVSVPFSHRASQILSTSRPA